LLSGIGDHGGEIGREDLGIKSWLYVNPNG
jgi:hypothetical protein